MDNIPKELEENQLSVEVVIDPAKKYLTMKTHVDNKSESTDLVRTESLSEDPLLQTEKKQIDFDKMNDLEQLIYLERARLLNLPPLKIKKKDNSCNWSTSETECNNQLTQKEKSKLRMRKIRAQESEEEHEHRLFRERIRLMKKRLLLKLQNFEDDSCVKEINKRASDKVKQKRLQLKANETPEQQALRKSQVNMVRRRTFLRNKAFSTPEDLLREKEKRIKYLENTRSRRSEEQRNSKRINDNVKAKERRKQVTKEWVTIQKAIKGKLTEDVKVTAELAANV